MAIFRADGKCPGEGGGVSVGMQLRVSCFLGIFPTIGRYRKRRGGFIGKAGAKGMGVGYGNSGGDEGPREGGFFHR